MTRSFTYSASGNVTLDDLGGSGTVLTYNSLDRLVRVSAGAVTLVDYVYAATGQRAIKQTPAATTHYLYDPGGALYAETDGAGNVLREYITLGGATVAIVDALGVGYVHDDHLGTPQVMTDGLAAVVWDASYRPFGEATIAGAVANDQRFPGQTGDAETGWYDNWHRTYDPGLGRYLQSDPIGIMAGFNTYGYAAGNPVMFTDPTGEIAQGIIIGGVVGALIGGGVEAGDQLYRCGRIYDPWAVARAALGGGIAGAFAVWSWPLGWVPYALANGAVGGLIGGGLSVANGGDFWPAAGWGFAVGAAGSLAGKGIAAIGGKLLGSAGRTAGNVGWKNGWRTPDGKFASPLGPGRPGKSAEEAAWDAIKSNKPDWTVVEGNVSVRNAAGDLRVYDGVAISPRGNVIGLEVKSGTAVRNAYQKGFDAGVSGVNKARTVGQHGNIGDVGGVLTITIR